MKNLNFCGVAVHPAYVPTQKPTMVGVWLGMEISPQQHRKLMELNATSAPGHIGVRTGQGKTSVMYMGRILAPKTARQIALELSNAVAKVTGAHSILQQLRNYHEVSNALAA